MRKLLGLVAIFISTGLAFGQGGSQSGEILKSTSGQAGSVRVCTATATGTPCSPLANIYSDAALTSQIVGSVVTSDLSGNYNYYAAPGMYKEQLAAGAGTFTRTVTIAPNAAAVKGPFLPSVTGEDLGSTTKRWDAYIQTLEAQTVNGKRYVDPFSATDLGAQINALYAACPTAGCGIGIPIGSYSYTTPIVLNASNKPVHLECDGGGTSRGGSATILHYTPTSGTALTLANSPGARVSNCVLQGPASGTAIGVMVTDSIFGGISNVDISDFDTGMTFGSNTYVEFFDRMKIHDNATFNVLVNTGLTNFGENIVFRESDIYQPSATAFSTTCVTLRSPSTFRFENTSFDQCGLSLNGTAVHVDLISPHFELTNSTSPFVTIGASCSWCRVLSTGGAWKENGTGAGRTEFVKNVSTGVNVDNQVVLVGGEFSPNETVAQIVNSTHATCCSTAVVIEPMQGIGGPVFTNPIGGTWAAGSYSSYHGAIKTSGAITAAGLITGTAGATITSPLTVSMPTGADSPSCVMDQGADNPRIKCYRTTGGGTFYPMHLEFAFGHWFFKTGAAVATRGSETVSTYVDLDTNPGGTNIFNQGIQPAATGGPVTWFQKATHASLDLASVATNVCSAEQTETITGSALGDACLVSSGTALEAGGLFRCAVTAANTVKWQFCNETALAIDRASDTYTIRVIR